MRNGIYRIWLTTAKGKASGAAVFKDGDIFAVYSGFAFNGRYHECGGQMTSTIAAKRLIPGGGPPYPDLDTFTISAHGPAGREFASATATINEVPGHSLAYECAFLCEA